MQTKNKRQIFAALIAVLISVTLVAVAVYAVTTVGDDVSVGGDLTVSGDAWINNNLYLGALKNPVPAQSGASAIIYVDAVSGDDTSGNGTNALPYQTITRALQDIPTIMLHDYTIQLAAGTYRETVVINKGGSYYESTGSTNYLTIKGDSNAPDSYRITGADAGADTTPVRSYGIKINSPYITKLEGIKIDYVSYAGVFVIDSYVKLVDININYAAWIGIYVYYHSLLDFRNSTVNIIGNYPTNDTYGISFNNGGGGMFGDSNTTINISEVRYGLWSFSGMSAGMAGSAINISNISKESGTYGIELGQTEAIHDITGSITNFDIGVGVYNNSYLDLDSPFTFSNVNTALDVDMNGSVDIDTTTFTSVTTKYDVTDGGVVNAVNESSIGKVIQAISGASSVVDGTSTIAFDFDTINSLTTDGAKLLSLSNSGNEKFYIDKDGEGYFAGNVGIGTSTPSGDLHVIDTTASSTVYIGNATHSGCIVIGDSDNGGLTYITVLNGVLTATSTKPAICK